MDKKKFQLKFRFYIMLKAIEEIIKVDEDAQEEAEDFEAKIQWKIADMKGYQIFKDGKYSFKIDEDVDDPNLTFIIEDVETATAIFNGDIDRTSAYMSGDLKIEGDLQLAMMYGSFGEFVEDYLEPIRQD